MKYVTKNLMLGALFALPLGAANAVEFAADIELDTDMNDNSDMTTFTQGGRLRVQASGRKEMNGYFVSGHLEGLFKEDSTTGTDNAYIMFGNQSWDVQAGRFEGINLFPLGKDTVVSHVTGTNGVVYEANLGRGRIGDNAGGIALHIKPGGALRFEIDTVWGDNVGGSDEDTFSVIRPSLTFTGAGFTVTAGLENRTADDAAGNAVADDSGAAVTANFDAGGANINVNFSTLTDDVNDRDTDSIGANAIIGNFGVGLVSSSSKTDGAPDADITTLYAAYSQSLLGIDGATVTYAISDSSLDESGTSDDSLTVLRVRLNYEF
jgi:hypothetical protein